MAASSRSSSLLSAAARPKRLGSTTPRVFTRPLVEGKSGPCGCGCALTADTTAGFAVVEFAESVLEVDLYPWQRWLLIHGLEYRVGGGFRFRSVIVLVARQNGKSTLSQVLALWFMYVLGVSLVIGTAQDLDVAEEIWQGCVDIVEETPDLDALKERVVKVNGKKSLELRKSADLPNGGGQRYKVKAANRRAGRGLSGDLVLLDELREHQSWDAYGAISKTMMARAEAMLWALSNAGDASSIVLRYLRKMAHAALGDPDGLNSDDSPGDLLPNEEDAVDVEEIDLDEDDLGIFEWSAPSGCAVTDRDGWAQANPSLGYGITERAVASACRTDPEWVFRTEVLCQWSDGSLEGPFPPETWEAGLDPESRLADGEKPSFCVDVSWNRSRSYIGIAGMRADGLPHVQVAASLIGTELAVPWFQSRATGENPMTVVVQAKGSPASSLVEDLKTVEHLTVIEWGGSDLGIATGQLYDLVRNTSPAAGLRHVAQPVLDVAAATAIPKPLGDAYVWDRKRSPNDVAPLIAVTGALWHLLQPTEEPPPPPDIF